MSSTQVGSIHYDLSLDTKKFDSAMDSVGNKLSDIGSSMKRFGSTMTKSVTLPLGILTTGLVASAAQLEKTAASFDVLVGDATKAKKLFYEIKKFADTTPFEFRQLSQAATTLLGYGVAADDVINRLKKLGDAAAASGGDLNGITLAYAQMIGRGKVTGDNLRQLTENMVTLREELSKVSGVPMEQLDKAIESGTISIEDLNAALDMATDTGGKFFGGTDKLAKTFSGRLSTLKDQLTEVGLTLIGVKVDPELGLAVQDGGLFDRLSKLIPVIADGADKLAKAFEKLPASQQNAAMAGVGLLAALGPMASVIGGVASALGVLIPLLGNPVFWIVAAVVAAIAGAAVLLYKNWDKIQALYNSKIKPMWDSFVRAMQPVIEYAKRVWGVFQTQILPVLQQVWGFIVGQFQAAWRDLKTAFDNVMKALGPLAPYMDDLARIVMYVGITLAGVGVAGVLGMATALGLLAAGVARVVGWFSEFYSWMFTLAGALGGAVRSAIDSVINYLGNMWGAFWNAGYNIINGLVEGVRAAFWRVYTAVLDGLAWVRNLLPFSPAKDGPFSGKGWTLYSGQSMMQGLADGITQMSDMPRLALEDAMSKANISLQGNRQVNNTSSTNIGSVIVNDRTDADYLFGLMNRQQQMLSIGASA